MLVLFSHGWVSGHTCHTTTRNKDTLLFIKTKESLRMHLKKAQEPERSARRRWRRRRVDKDGSKMGPVLENQWRRQYVGYFYFLFRLYIFLLFWILVTGRLSFFGRNLVYNLVRPKRVRYDWYLNRHKTPVFLFQCTCRNGKYRPFQPIQYEIDFLGPYSFMGRCSKCYWNFKTLNS